MPLQNRVTSAGEIINDPSRAARFMGNRGILHDDERRLGRARWKHRAWIVCALSFKGRQWSLMAPGCYTELFFLDEAVALAAGHRPCAECRREAYTRFLDGWTQGRGGRPKATTLDATLHEARIERNRRDQHRHEADFATLPDGVFIEGSDRGGFWLVLDDALLRYSPSGYGELIPRPARGAASVLTPEPAVDVLAAGYLPELHPTAIA